ncbi:hypothetical protein CWI38_0491p0030 [Hamiltosporidium tvaerminnensis]|uniref:Uncharacterized protein n=1 Tax=Hamiltosporidium tvaerminnensis TaxID=1176355 RepID=A0A4Q9LX31_9MICR|nr:hypothetical protein CWI38_0491p0030 [Hamiltosporidium tvaerminnensis]
MSKFDMVCCLVYAHPPGASDRPTGKSELFGSLFGLGAAKVADPFYNPYRAGYRRGVGYGYGTGAAVGGVGYGFP